MPHSAKLKIVVIAFIVLSAIGFLDATYLTIEHHKGRVPPCAIQGCEIVLTSGQSKIIGVPVALLGSLYYLAVLIMSIIYLESGKVSVLRFASFFTIIGIIVSAYFVYLQLFVIHQICQYCLISAGTSTALFGFGVWVRKIIKLS